MTRKPAKRQPVSTRALVQRINRKLAHDNEGIRKVRGTAGSFVQVDFLRGMVISTEFTDLEDFGREIGVLERWEEWRDR